MADDPTEEVTFFLPACGCNERRGRICFYHKLRTIQFGGRGKSPQTQMESRWAKDMPAYQRLRANGLQPPHIEGCAKLESTANSQLEIEMGDLVDNCIARGAKGSRKTIIPQIAENMAIAKDMDWTPNQSVDACKENRGVR